jgi:hypothetical protein
VDEPAASVVEYLPGSQLAQYRMFRVFKNPKKVTPCTDILTNHRFTSDRMLMPVVAHKYNWFCWQTLPSTESGPQFQPLPDGTIQQ